MSDSPGGMHYYADNKLDMRLAWSEGFAGYISSSIKEWLKTYNSGVLSTPTDSKSTQYVDTDGTTATYVDIVNSTGGASDPFVYSTNEISISKVLWETEQEIGVDNLIAIINSYMKDTRQNDTDVRVNSELFWNGLLSAQNLSSTQLSTYESIFTERKINYLLDTKESDESVTTYSSYDCTTTASGNQCFSETRNLYFDPRYNTEDRDYIQVSMDMAKTYIIETIDLRNGADTNLIIFDSAGAGINPVSGAENDDFIYSVCGTVSFSGACLVNDGVNMRSKITFTPTYTGIYFIEIKSTPDPEPAPFAGKYGDYTHVVSVQ
ncbi:MAG: hypothetical protein GQ470_07130 [Gammaproteobacteria bacterium]|nr:hypothetical protein [Gammaproteobacteria bacterium]